MITLETIQQALALTDFDAQAFQRRMSPVPRVTQNAPQARQAGVLVLLFPHSDQRWHILLTRRNENLRGHSGQISFPGGKRDAGDADFTATALRETCEELGICEDIEVLGHLAQVYIPPSNFDVYPTVATMPYTPSPLPNPDEVAEVLSVAVDDLLNPAFKSSEVRNLQGHEVLISYYAVNGHKVWGATALMLGELEARLHIVTQS